MSNNAEKITFTSIARELGVTTSVVSRVMKNNSTTISIGRETKKKILTMAWERGLQLNRNIGLIASGRDEISTFYPPAAAGILERCGELGFGIFSGHYKEESNAEIPEFLLKRSIGGIISFDNIPKKIKAFLAEENIPCVVMNPSINPLSEDCILFNDYENMMELLLYLSEKRYKSYIYISSDSRIHYSQMVMKSFSDFLKKGSFEGQILTSTPSRELEILALLEKLVRNSTSDTVFITPARFFTMKILEFFSKHGKRLPKDGGVVGCSLLADYYIPKLTTIYYPFYEMGVTAVDMLKDKWKTRQFNIKSRIILGRLIKNEST